jgi:MFS family permease
MPKGRPRCKPLVSQLAVVEKAERVKALTIWGALSGLGFAIGIPLGGAISECFSPTVPPHQLPRPRVDSACTRKER